MGALMGKSWRQDARFEGLSKLLFHFVLSCPVIVKVSLNFTWNYWRSPLNYSETFETCVSLPDLMRNSEVTLDAAEISNYYYNQFHVVLQLHYLLCLKGRKISTIISSEENHLLPCLQVHSHFKHQNQLLYPPLIFILTKSLYESLNKFRSAHTFVKLGCAEKTTQHHWISTNYVSDSHYFTVIANYSIGCWNLGNEHTIRK